MRFVHVLLIALPFPLPALAAAPPELCGHMANPAVDLTRVTTGFRVHGHSGVDLMAPYGSPIRAAAPGVVAYAGRYFAYGNIVDIRHADGVITRYAHMSAFAPGISPGARVDGGDVIGRVGTTGRAHGPHVHFEVRIDGSPVDPKPYLAMAACPPMREPLEQAQAPNK